MEDSKIMHMNPQHIDLYLPLQGGGPSVWGYGLAREMHKAGKIINIRETLDSYFGEPFRRRIVHSTLPFVTKPFGIPYILTIHGNYRAEHNIWSHMFPLAIKRADVITVPSNFLKTTLDLPNSIVIPNGIYQPRHTKIDYAFLDKNPTFGILTNFSFPEKSEGAIRLAKIIKNVSPASKLIIGGDGSHISHYKAKLDAVGIDYELLGRCNKEDLFNRIDIFSYYSLLDNQPLALLEAMAYGLPVISNSIGAIPEILIGELAPYLCNSEEEYCLRIESLMNPDIRKSNGANARTRAKAFDWSVISTEWQRLYTRVGSCKP